MTTEWPTPVSRRVRVTSWFLLWLAAWACILDGVCRTLSMGYWYTHCEMNLLVWHSEWRARLARRGVPVEPPRPVAVVSVIEAENDLLREALAFYANPDTYAAISLTCDPPCGPFADDTSTVAGSDYDRAMPGARARAAFVSAAALSSGGFRRVVYNETSAPMGLVYATPHDPRGEFAAAMGAGDAMPDSAWLTMRGFDTAEAAEDALQHLYSRLYLELRADPAART